MNDPNNPERGKWYSFGSLFAQGHPAADIHALSASGLVKTQRFTVGEGLTSMRLFIADDADLKELMAAGRFIAKRKTGNHETPDFDTVAS